MDALQVFVVGAFLGALVWVPLGRASLLLLMRRSWRAQQQRQVRRAVPRPVHAGQYVDPGRVRAGVCGLEYPSFRRVPG